MKNFLDKISYVLTLNGYAVTSNLFRNLFRRTVLPSVLSIMLAGGLSLTSCSDNPTNLGLNFIPPGETTGVRIFDSYFDTMTITSTNVKKFVNTSSSGNLIVGQSGNYNSKGLIIFTNLNTDQDSSTVLQAVLKLRYRNYYFPNTLSDSLGQISFDIYTIQNRLNFSQVTLDSVTSTTFGTTSQGNYTGSPAADSEEVDIPINTILVEDWLEYAADTGYSVKNYGIALITNSGSSVLKGFYSANVSGVQPALYYIINKNGNIDTVFHNVSQTVFLADGSVQANDEFFVHAGISYYQILRFDVSVLPSTVTINDAQLFLMLDPANSIFTNQTAKSLTPNYINDTAGLDISALPVTTKGVPSSTNPNQYVFRLVAVGLASPFQRWLSGQPNYGLLISADNDRNNLDRFAFYDITSTVPNTKPRVIIKYTPRVTDAPKPEIINPGTSN